MSILLLFISFYLLTVLSFIFIIEEYAFVPCYQYFLEHWLMHVCHASKLQDLHYN